MDMNDGSIASQSSNGATVAHSVWKHINNPVIAIFSDLRNSEAQETLYSLLESILKGSATLTTVLVPPFNNGIQNEELQEQYAAFTTWFFGAMFYILGDPLSEATLANSIEIQACMLRILSRHHITMFQKISLKYIEILQDIIEFYENGRNEQQIILAKFSTERTLIENVDLKSFPIIIKYSEIQSIQISVLKVITKAGVSMWDQTRLFSILLGIILKCPPDTKFVAFNICTHLMEFSTPDERDFMDLALYTIEIVKTIPTWLSSAQLSINKLSHYVEIITRFVLLSTASSNLTDLCLQIIAFIAQELTSHDLDAAVIRKLEGAACNKIKNYLIIEPRTCTPLEAQRFVSFIQHCPVWIR
ncbi:hypothetical protein KM043_011857 [Ampulex compressa]|nr:hypothetical protein KM043_011857 [Ampulex compressa]